MRAAALYLALAHHPVLNKRLEVITSSVTNLDIHDIARAARTFEVDGFLLLHPLPAQRELVMRILSYWQRGGGAAYNPDRSEAFERLHLLASLEEARAWVREASGADPLVVVTDARPYPNSIGYAEMRRRLQEPGSSYLLVFGTGWGLAPEVMAAADLVLEPIAAVGTYNHLSVRSAVAIILDRLLSDPASR
ncbi:MAG: RNA methyltransferase [Syntrophomonadaceae bacterium]|nr:RNA methyltransferase [Syntrophomonadaceae bacterium]